MKYIIRSIEAFLLALLLALIFAFFFREEQAGKFGGLVLIVGLAVFAIILFRSSSQKVHFLFCLIFGIEWLLLPAITYINLEYGAGTLGEALGDIVFFGLFAGIGIAAGAVFLSLAILFFLRGRKSKKI